MRDESCTLAAEQTDAGDVNGKTQTHHESEINRKTQMRHESDVNGTIESTPAYNINSALMVLHLHLFTRQQSNSVDGKKKYTRSSSMDVTGPNYSSTPYQHMSYSNPGGVQQTSMQQNVQPNQNCAPQLNMASTQSYTPQQNVQSNQSYTPQQNVQPNQSYTPQQNVQPNQSYTPQQNVQPNQGRMLQNGQVVITPRHAPYPRQITAPDPVKNADVRIIQVGDGLVQTNPNTYKLALSDFKSLTLNEYKGYTYAHIWNNAKKVKVSLNYDELKQLLAHGKELVASMEVMQLGERVQSDICTGQW